MSLLFIVYRHYNSTIDTVCIESGASCTRRDADGTRRTAATDNLCPIVVINTQIVELIIGNHNRTN